MRLRHKMRFVFGFLVGVSFCLVCLFGFFNNGISDLRSSFLPFAFERSSVAVTSNCLEKNESANTLKMDRILCVINGNSRKPLECRLDLGNTPEVFVPFSFIASYFEISGKLEVDKKSGKNERVLNWQHSNAKLIIPKLPYESDGIFMSFDNYNVEVRDRVKCISASEGVPISSQWTTFGHYYPIQISQFGLSHYSKNITEEQPRIQVVTDFEHEVKLTIPAGSSAERVEDEEKKSWVLNFVAQENYETSGIGLVFPGSGVTGEPYLKFWIKFGSNGSLTVLLDVHEKEKMTYELVYTCGNLTVRVEGNRIEYGIGYPVGWKLLVRDVYIDLLKGLSLKLRKSGAKKDKFKPNFSRLKITEIVLRGEGWVDDVVLASSAHSELFYSAADWLVRNQDSNGGWPIMVKRKLGKDLQPGWYSAMAQGHGISMLTRAYLKTRREKYLNAAVDALKLFSVPSQAGGVLAVFMEKFNWYEEYPTTPSSFVLNGFIYALLGLYDLKMIATKPNSLEAEALLDSGMKSLKALLPLFDTGSGSVYDLRHFTMGGPPNLARWDYHATHITQLMVINSIYPDAIFEEYIDRWSGYMKGQRAEHN